MAKNWAICIGINKYENMPELNYGVRDAEEMKNWFEQAASFDKVYLFTDNSPPINDASQSYSSQPTYTKLSRFLRTRFDKPFLSSGDNLWFFFSGHGLVHNDKDYLMPIDGDPHPEGVEGTALTLTYLTERLKRCGADNVVIIYDACRNQQKSKGLGIGNEQQKGVITLAACSPNERSYEIDEVQHGSFTYALLEALQNTQQGQGNYATFERLYQRLRYRVLDINQQYKKPRQTPFGFVTPDEKRYWVLLPKYATTVDIETHKKQALNAELNNQLESAKRLLIRLWEICPGDEEVRQYYERVIVKIAQQQDATPPPVSPPLDTGNKSILRNFQQDFPIIVGNYLDEVGLKTGTYKENLEDGKYYASSPYQSLSKELSGDFLPNNIAYYITGDKSQIKELKLVLNINHILKAEKAHNMLVNYGDILFQKALGIALPFSVRQSIEKGLSCIDKIEDCIIKVIRENWPARKGYEMNLIITDEVLVNIDKKIKTIINDGGINRFSLMQTLSSIPQEQLLQIIFTLDPPKGIIPLNTSQGQQVFALLQWAESPSGSGLEQVQAVLDKIIKLPVNHSKSVTESSSIVTVEVELKSEKGVDYSKLKQLLAQQKWEEADQETAKVMLQAANQVKRGYLNREDLENFPCEDLRTINQLWLHYSNGKFGFSVQAEIYRSLGGTKEYNSEIWKKFCDRVGWRKGDEWLDYSDLDFHTLALDAPNGNLPCLGWVLWGGCGFGERGWGLVVSLLAFRLVDCSFVG